MLTAFEIQRLRGSRWRTTFDQQTIKRIFRDQGPAKGILTTGQFCLTWLIEKMFCNQQGKPLKLEAFQSVMLDMLWHKKFPMVLACRGAGKCQTGSTLVQTDDGLYRFDELIDPSTEPMTEVPLNMHAIGENGANAIGYGWNNGFKDTKKIRTAFGFEVENTLDHKIRVLDGKHIKWKKSRNVQVGDIVPIVRTSFDFGDDSTLSEDQGWWLGATIGDGYLGQKSYISLTNIDEDIINEWSRIGEDWSGRTINLQSCKDRTQSYAINSRAFVRLINDDYGCDYQLAHGKQIPLIIRRSSKSVVAAFLSGLFDTDGGMTKRSFEFSTVSEELSRQVQSCLLAFGILSNRREKVVKLNGNEHPAFVITVFGSNNLSILRDEIGFRCKRKQDLLIELCNEDSNPNKDTLPHQLVTSLLLELSGEYRKLYAHPGSEYNYDRQLLAPSQLRKYRPSYNKLDKILQLTSELSHVSSWKKLDEIRNRQYFYDEVVSVEAGHCQTYDIHVPEDHTFISNGFISHNTFMLALYALLRAMLVPGSKIIIAGAGFRQAKLVFHYIDTLYHSSPLIREALRAYGGPKYGSDAATLKVNLSIIKAIPIGDGEKIRGERATVLICDEFASVPEEIFEIVLAPFGAVPMNPTEKAAFVRFVRRLERLGAGKKIIQQIQSTQDFGNQVVVSGTATHQQNHFYKRYKVYRMFVDSGGDPDKLRRALEGRAMETTGQAAGINADDVNKMVSAWKQYAIFQMPYQAFPEGFLEEDVIRSCKASYSQSRFAMEFLAQFPEDTDGFYKRSAIEGSTPRPPNDIPVVIELYGDPKYTYILGLDPARHNDNFGAVVLKLTSRGKELVYCDSWNKTRHELSAKKIFEIMRRFPTIEYIAMDKGGGGDAVSEWLCKTQEGIKPHELIWPIKEQLEKKSDMAQPGRKILELVNFKGWVNMAAYNLEAAIDRHDLLFPYRGDDNAVQQQYQEHFKEKISDHTIEMLARDLWGVDDWEAKQYDMHASVGAFGNIGECVDETCAIAKTVTPNGTEQFELPRLTDQPEGLDMRRRDRFSALLLANYAARTYLSQNRVVKSGGSSRSVRSSKSRSMTQGTFRRRGSVAY